MSSIRLFTGRLGYNVSIYINYIVILLYIIIIFVSKCTV